MSEEEQNSKEISLSPDDINEINSELIKHLRGSLRDYPGIKELLDEGSIDLLDPSRSLKTANWEYVFIRAVPEFLQLSISKRSASKESKELGIIEEKIDIIYGENPLIQYDVTQEGKMKEPPKKNTSETVRLVSSFVSDFASQL